MDKELWVAEYSYNQKCFHHDLLERSLQMNRNNISKGQPNDYLIFHIGTSDETTEAINKMTDILIENGFKNKIEEEYVD